MLVTEALEEWIVEELSVSDPELNNIWPCPYAKKAWFKNKVKVVETSDDFWDITNQEIDNFNDDYEVVIVAQENSFCEYNELENSCMALNRWFAQKEMNIWLLSFKTDITMVFIQRLSKLDDASKQLLKQGYYNSYNTQDFNNLILERSKRRTYDARNDAWKKQANENDAWWN